MRRPSLPALIYLIILLVLLLGCSSPEPLHFDGERAHTWIIKQCDLGYRPTGSEANILVGDMILKELQQQDWQTEVYTFTYYGTEVRNILAWKGEGPALVIGTHYDTRRQADEEDPTIPVLGANDGASGTAVLLELARVLDIPDDASQSVYLAFFDAEDNGRLDGWDWIAGSAWMAQNWKTSGLPDITSLVIVDMVGDADQQIYWDRNSNRDLNTELWGIAAEFGHTGFIPEDKYSMLDDHSAFIYYQVAKQASVIIDFDYPYWHTTQDTPDKTSAASLQSVGDVMQTWLNRRLRQ